MKQSYRQVNTDENASEPKEFVELHGGHNDAFLASKEIFIKSIDSFINRL